MNNDFTQKKFSVKPNCFCANTLYPAQAIHCDKCNLTHFSKMFWFEDFSWMLPRATKNALAGHMWPAGC